MSLRLELLDSLSIPGDAAKPNEDSFIAEPFLAAVFDGATGLGERLMPGASDAQWIAQFGARRLRAHAESGEGALRDWLRAAAADAEKSFKALRRRAPLENYEIAYASAMMIAPREGALDLLWFGDCALLLRDLSGRLTMVGDTIDRREVERARVRRLVKPGRGPAAAGVRDEFLPALRASRSLVNTPGGDWLFAPDAACADHAKDAQLAVDADCLVLLASDGFLALVSDYRRYTPETLFAAATERGLGPLGEELRAIESGDPDGLVYPRFKRSDDATALLLAFR